MPNDRPRNIANDMIDAIETATKKWTRQKKAEERHPGNIHYRASRMTKVASVKQKHAAWKVMEQCYRAVSGPRGLPAKVRQIYYQARPKIMALTCDKALDYNYFSQTLVPDYIEEHGVEWNVVYDARGHFEEPHTNRRIGCGTLEVDNYLGAIKEPSIVAPEFSDAAVDIIGPAGGYGSVLYVEKEGFGPLFKAVDLANRYDLMIISNKGLSVTAGRKLIDAVCGDNDLPLFVLHDFDFDGFKIFGTLQRDTRRYEFSNAIEASDLGLRLADITGLEREPAAATRTRVSKLREQLTNNGATDAEIDILLRERVELNAMTSEALVEMIERKLNEYGLEKVVPGDDQLAETYRAFHRSRQLRERFEQMEKEFDANQTKATQTEVPDDLRDKLRAVLTEHPGLRWDEAIKLVLNPKALEELRAKKQEAREKSGDFTGVSEWDQAIRRVLGEEEDDSDE
jgi:hypothetical protein